MYHAQKIIRTEVSTRIGSFQEIRIQKYQRAHRMWGKWQLFDYDVLHLFEGKYIISLGDFEKAEELFSMRMSGSGAIKRVKDFYAFETELQGVCEVEEGLLNPLYEAYHAKVREEIGLLEAKLIR